jgi:hypothetical protein
MKINKYNETNTDNIYYEGDITVHFKVLKKDIEKYSSIFSDNWVNARGTVGIIEHYVLGHVDTQNLIIKDVSNSEIEKNITYKLYVDGNEMDEKLFNKSNKYNI